jgi:hypothetical protein
MGLAQGAAPDKQVQYSHALTVWSFLEHTPSCSQEDAFSAMGALKSIPTAFAHNVDQITTK